MISFKRLTISFKRGTNSFKRLTTSFKRLSTSFKLLTTSFKRLSTSFKRLTTLFKRLTTSFKRLSTSFKRVTTSFKRDSFLFFLFHNVVKGAPYMCKGNSAKLWQCMKTLGVGPTVLKTPKALKTNGNITTKPELIAETFNSFFTDIASNLLSLLPRDVIENEYSPSDTLINYISDRLPIPARFNIPLITKEYVYKSILDLNPNKSVGLDEIGARFLHIAAKEITEPLYHIINTSILTSTFHDNWKRARVFAVFKSGSDLECDHSLQTYFRTQYTF